MIESRDSAGLCGEKRSSKKYGISRLIFRSSELQLTLRSSRLLVRHAFHRVPNLK